MVRILFQSHAVYSAAFAFRSPSQSQHLHHRQQARHWNDADPARTRTTAALPLANICVRYKKEAKRSCLFTLFLYTLNISLPLIIVIHRTGCNCLLDGAYVGAGSSAFNSIANWSAHKTRNDGHHLTRPLNVANVSPPIRPRPTEVVQHKVLIKYFAKSFDCKLINRLILSANTVCALLALQHFNYICPAWCSLHYCQWE